MFYKKVILIFLLLSKAFSLHFYASAPQKYTRENNSKSNSKNKVAISWNGINYLFINNLYYFSAHKYTFRGSDFYPVWFDIQYRRISSDPPFILEKKYRFFARIQEFLYNLLSFSLYFFKKSFFYKIDILGNDVFFYPMTADYTTNILSIILGTTACKISLQDDIKLECRFGIGLTWRRLSYSYAVSYKCKECHPGEIIVDRKTDIDNKLSYKIRGTHLLNGAVSCHNVLYENTRCNHFINFFLLENLKESYTWKHFDIVINCSFLLRSKVTFCLNLNFGILEAWQVYKYNTLIHRNNNVGFPPTFSIPFVLRHFSLNISYLS